MRPRHTHGGALVRRDDGSLGWAMRAYSALPLIVSWIVDTGGAPFGVDAAVFVLGARASAVG